MLVILLMFEAAKPKNWQWMWNAQAGADASQKDGDQDLKPLAQVENVNRANRDAKEQTEFATLQADQPLAAPSTKSSHPEDSFISKPIVPLAAAHDGQPSDDDATNLVVDQELLSRIQDNTFFRPDEQQAWFHLLRILRDSKELSKMPVSEVGYGQLFRQMDVYRGRLVRIEGEIRRAHWLNAPRNDFGFQGYWQCYVRLYDGSNSPVVVYALDLPDGFPNGMSLREAVSITGFGYKRWSYAAADKPSVAPVVLARTAEWHPELARVAEPEAPQSTIWLTILVATVAAIVVVGLVYAASNWSPDRAANDERNRVAQFARQAADRSLPTVEDSLRELGRSRD